MDKRSNDRIVTDSRFSMIPHWVIFSGVSSGAIHLYAVLAKYADKDGGESYPARSTLAKHLDKSVDTIDRLKAELVDIGALRVTRRKKAGTKQNYSNLYTLVTANPHAEVPPEQIEVGDEGVAAPVRPGSRMSAAGNYTHSTTPIISSTSDQRSNAPLTRARSASAPMRDEPGDLSGGTRAHLRRQIQKIGVQVRNGHSFQSEHVTGLWQDFVSDLGEYAGHVPGMDELIDQMDNGKWTIGKAEADPYRAGVKLNKMIHAAGCL